jgi:hypothetical protein
VLDSVNRVSAVGRQAMSQVGQVDAAVKELTAVVAELGSTSAQLGALAGSLQVTNA